MPKKAPAAAADEPEEAAGLLSAEGAAAVLALLTSGVFTPGFSFSTTRGFTAVAQSGLTAEQLTEFLTSPANVTEELAAQLTAFADTAPLPRAEQPGGSCALNVGDRVDLSSTDAPWVSCVVTHVEAPAVTTAVAFEGEEAECYIPESDIPLITPPTPEVPEGEEAPPPPEPAPQSCEVGDKILLPYRPLSAVSAGLPMEWRTATILRTLKAAPTVRLTALALHGPGTAPAESQVAEYLPASSERLCRAADGLNLREAARADALIAKGYALPLTETSADALALAVEDAPDGAANLAIPSLEGRMPLHVAAIEGSVGAIERLAEMGASLDAREASYGQSAMHLAAGLGHEAVVQCLLGKGATASLQDNEGGWTPIHAAARSEQQGTLSLLLGNVADTAPTAIDTQSRASGETALHRAAVWGCYRAVEVLLECAPVHPPSLLLLLPPPRPLSRPLSTILPLSQSQRACPLFLSCHTPLHSRTSHAAHVRVPPAMANMSGRRLSSVVCPRSYGARADIVDSSGKTAAQVICAHPCAPTSHQREIEALLP
eukprot:COSAG05_NODE_628_length_8241_cov_5.614468_9_plen_546_part_00